MEKVNVVGTEGLDVATATCGLCSKPISEHVTDAGFGCPDAPMKHPLRRESDADIVFVPLRMVLDAASGEVPAKRAKTRKQSRVKRGATGDTPKQRGRIAGLYVVGKKKPAKMTDSQTKVFGLVKRHKNGMGLKDIASKLDMPSGTVGWALQKLAKQGAVEHSQPV